ncbi:MAG: MaoC family dehydratase N-terminal domain-containing protein [Pseudomonadota bacterium]
MNDPQQAVGRQMQRHDALDPERARAMHATLDLPGPAPGLGDPLPRFWHWAYFWDSQPPEKLGRDGHPRPGGAADAFIPNTGLPRRMWAGGAIEWFAPLPLGKPALRRSTISDVAHKAGRSGPLAFVTVTHELLDADGSLAVRERQDIVYRPDPDPDPDPESETEPREAEPSTPEPSIPEPGVPKSRKAAPDRLAGRDAGRPAMREANPTSPAADGPQTRQASPAAKAPSSFPAQKAPRNETLRARFRPDATQLFRYSALTFNGHRIHYDLAYCREVEGYPGLVVHGPLMAQRMIDLAAQHLTNLTRFSFRAMAPVFCPAAFEACAKPDGDGLALWIRREDGGLAMQAQAA